MFQGKKKSNQSGYRQMKVAQNINENDDEQSTTVEGSDGDDVEGNDETTDTVLTEETNEANNDEMNDEEKDDDVHESDSDDNLEGSGEEKTENPQTATEGGIFR